MHLVSLRLPTQLLIQLDKRAKKLRLNRSQLVRTLLEEGLNEGTVESEDRFERLRNELLLAVGQVGASVKEIPRFINAASEVRSKRANVIDASKMEKPTTTQPKPTSNIETPTVAETPNGTDMKAESTKAAVTNSTAKWSYAAGAEKAPLRPRVQTVHDPSQDLTIEAELVQKPSEHASSLNQSVNSISGEHDASLSPPGVERRSARSDNVLVGLAIGDERRQSIRLARVLSFKGWDEAFLAQRLKMPLQSIQDALAGQGDLASLKVEALLATWEDEMLVSGWTADGIIPTS